MTGQPMTFIYVIGPSNGVQKIGISNNPRGRLTTIQTGSPLAVSVWASIAVTQDDCYRIEQCIHWMLSEKHVRGEWFNVTPDEAVAAVHAAISQVNTPGHVYKAFRPDVRKARITGTSGRKPGGSRIFTDEQITAVLHLGTAGGSKEIGMSRTQFIHRVNLIREKEKAASCT